jgi:predicted nucleic acid-binding protein
VARALDASFLIDLLNGHDGATAKARELDVEGEAVYISAPALAEYLDGAHFLGGAYLQEALRLIAGFDIVPFDKEAGAVAAQLRSDLRRQGRSLAMIDAMIAALALRHHHVLVTRDSVFTAVPGLAVESY